MTVLQESIVRDITDVFADALYPGDGNIAYDQSGSHLECNQVQRNFRGKLWSNLTTDFLSENADAIFFFSPQAYAYFLPAFMRSSVTGNGGDSILLGNVVVSLSISLSQSTTGQFMRRINYLTVTQRQTVAKYLEYVATAHANDLPLDDARIALEEFWSRYSDQESS